ncbi:PadR family transcriptional regulator [Actinotalea ferrariae]|uniref:PadR family transcriptional regulator n=1 Tax=Actinotalea ferrariae TaxID=1386098 RepID=UPI001C8B95C4|nr:PadR family transcriptional regulator [Actinotalea ferrariae]MBX9243712.1 PadR family transcriptional regulator [Actinotalea ferrariae]
MAATETRLLVLGAVRLFEPVNGYQIRRELLSWGVDEWAHVLPGSIYSSLATLTKQGHLVRQDVEDGGRTVAVYATTSSGRDELDRLFGHALTTVDPLDPLPVHTAMSMCSLFPRDVVAAHLETRAGRLDLHLADLRAKHAATAGGASPPHVAHVLELRLGIAELERTWVRDLVDVVRRGGLSFAGEPMSWQPAADDPGWQMAADRDRYLTLLRSRTG